ncbi:hypothetical protein VTK73DRAFT_2741 [Phialemonium thermophilum]|uniref:Uncharacterized protein n=1 Tax=Phialemonium thermophilum TaxID=223376 RepID=A0ABR3Y2H7_9PEZI
MESAQEKEAQKGQKAQKVHKAQKQPKAEKAVAKAAATVPLIIGMTASKDTNFSQWYHELVIKAELVEYYSEISGFYILRRLFSPTPSAFFLNHVCFSGVSSRKH